MLKKILLLCSTVLLLTACDFSLATKAKKRIIGTTWLGEITDYLPHYSYEISFTKDGYTLKYHKDAVNTVDVDHDAEDITIENTWSYLGSISKTWTGDWNARHSVTYHVVKIEEHPIYHAGAYICYELKSNVAYMEQYQPLSVDDMKYYTRLVLQK